MGEQIKEAVQAVSAPRARTDMWLQWFMVVLVLLGCMYMAIVNNEPSIVYNLTTLCFGYYFGTRHDNTGPPAAA